MSEQEQERTVGGDANAGQRAGHGLDDSDDGVDIESEMTTGEAQRTDRTGEVTDPDALRTRVRRLEDENERLRRKYAAARERRYRDTATGLAAVGAVFGIAGLVVTSAQEVLFAIAAAGLFGAVLTRYLTPEQFVPLDMGVGIYTTMAENEAAVADQLGLSSTRLYLSTPRGLRLFVPEVEAYDESVLDDPDELAAPLVVSDRAARSGLSVRPVAATLLDRFAEQHRGSLPSTPRDAVVTLGEGVTDALELAGGVEPDLDSAEGRVTFSLTDPLFGDVTRFDHPVASFLASGLARSLDTPVSVDVVVTERDGRETPLVTCRWNPDAVEGGDEAGESSEATGEDARETQGVESAEEPEEAADDTDGGDTGHGDGTETDSANAGNGNQTAPETETESRDSEESEESEETTPDEGDTGSKTE